ncbi:MAG: 30S ribosomal protein S13 [Methanomassiliicoccales archaeon]|nr:30S ribosomal protein S13 [Methanomassiliicoccales archaeon]
MRDRQRGILLAEAKKTTKTEEKDDFRYIVRIVNTDIDGNKPTVVGLQSIKGVGKRVAEVVVRKAGVDRSVKIGSLDEAATDELARLVTTYSEYAPNWAINRQADYETGEDQHIVSTDLDIVLKDDINRLKMIRCYRGVRHESGHKVRGQRTRSNGRKGLTLGVSKNKNQPAPKKEA